MSLCIHVAAFFSTDRFEGNRILERFIEVPASQRFPPSLTMAGTSQRLSSAVDELLQRVRDEGSMDSLLKELGYELGEFELVRESEGQGSMTDASKRRMVDEASPPPQMPMVRAAKARATSTLPSGVSSIYGRVGPYTGNGRKVREARDFVLRAGIIE